MLASSWPLHLRYHLHTLGNYQMAKSGTRRRQNEHTGDGAVCSLKFWASHVQRLLQWASLHGLREDWGRAADSGGACSFRRSQRPTQPASCFNQGKELWK